ncbi:MAG: TetR/AcrR family transcriptional regulator [Devosia sp.]|uniref:TetR/AcrR family transcriptional regulator n=1 Tax=unclassified Devosia TaxID=196773 RepID=UPI001A0B91EA|nr:MULTISPECIES: TetR/AcrR family transcriptional regulator [unclassified Devosia]MBF0678476.1 TetR/AcrR family transcriptional regulator [Devosia sp.]WEJ33153.1 TetR/AcrR family transcriptional regulator [Devosia sp. SD17-2]
MQDVKRTQEDRRAATREALLDAARGLFAEKGFAATSTPEIVAAAGVTRGALYHHFADKQALFAAVVEREHGEVASAIGTATDGAGAPADTIDGLVAGGNAYLSAMQEPGRRQIMLVDAPAVLGRAAVDAIDARHGLRSLIEGVQCALDDATIAPVPGVPLAHLLSAIFDRAAQAPADELDAYRVAVETLLRGLRRAPPAP